MKKLCFGIVLFFINSFAWAGPIEPFTENFDYPLSLPNLPVNWTTTATLPANKWKSVIDFSYSSPAALFAINPNTAGVSELVTPLIEIGDLGAPAQLKLYFRHRYSLEQRSATEGYDGGVVEVSFNGGPFQDVVTAGGNFISGGYTRRINSVTNPLHGRDCYSGTQTASFQEVQVNFPAIAQSTTNVRFRWRLGSDNVVGLQGWWIDNVSVAPVIDLVSSVVASPSTRVLYGSTARFNGAVSNNSPYSIGIMRAFLLTSGFDLGSVDFSRGTLTKFSPRVAILELAPPVGSDVAAAPGQSVAFGVSLPTSGPRNGAGVVSLAPGTPSELVLAGDVSSMGGTADDTTIEGQVMLNSDPCDPPAPVPGSSPAGKVVFIGEPVLPCTYANALVNQQALGAKAVVIAISGFLSSLPSAPIPGVSIPVLSTAVLSVGEFITVIGSDPLAAPQARVRYGRNLATLSVFTNSEAEDPQLKNNSSVSLVQVLSDSDADGTFDIEDQCPSDSRKIAVGVCGCGVADVDSNSNGAFDCQIGAEFKARVKTLNNLLRSLKAPVSSSAQSKFKTARKKVSTASKDLQTFGSAQSAGISVASGNSLGKLLKDLKNATSALNKASGNSNISKAKKKLQGVLKKLDKALT